MKPFASTVLVFIGCATSVGAHADFSDVFGRVKDVYNNVTSFHQNIYQTINDEISGGGGDQTTQAFQNFYNNQAPQEITDGSKLALTQIFPGVANAVDVADNVDKYASQWASQAQNNAQAKLDSSHGINACFVVYGGKCPPCPDGSPSGPEDGSCPTAPVQTPSSSITSTDLASIGASNTGATIAPTSLAADAQQLPGQLSTWDQQQAAAAARQLALQQQQQAEQARQAQLAAQAQAQAAAEKAQQVAQSENSGPAQADAPSSSSGWGSVLMQGLQQIQGARVGQPRNSASSGKGPSLECLQARELMYKGLPCNGDPYCMYGRLCQ